MCSIFGFIAHSTDRHADGPSLRILRDVVTANIQRGPHAFGFAWLDSRGRLRSYRQAGRLTERAGMLGMLRDARILIGHLRYATHGDPEANINNHPHPVDGGWLVHNGVVGNYRQLADRSDLHLSSECDSEAIAQLVEASAAPTLLGRCGAAIRRTTGPLAILGLWARPATLILGRRGNPLHWATTGQGMYFGSLAGGLPGKVCSAIDNQVVRLSIRSTGIISTSADLPAPKHRPSELFDRCAGGVYRGG